MSKTKSKKSNRHIILIFLVLISIGIAGAVYFFVDQLHTSALYNSYQAASDQLWTGIQDDIMSDSSRYAVLPGLNKSVVFITASCDQDEVLPIVRHTSGYNVKSAWRNTDKSFKNLFKSGEFDSESIKYLKCDIVTEINSIQYEDFRSELSDYYIGQYPYGIAFDKKFDIALLQQEWSHYRLYDVEQNNLLMSRIKPYLAGQYGHVLDAIPDDIIIFKCDSWLLDLNNNSITRLQNTDKNYGIRDFELTRDNLEVLISTSGYYLENNMTQGGRMQYAYYPQDLDTTENYSMVRHIDSLWALLQYYALTGDAYAQDIIDDGIAFLSPYILDFDELGKYIRCSDDDEIPEEIRMGGAGLLLVVLSEYERLFDSSIHRDLLDGVAQGIISQIQEDGHVPHVLNLDLSVSRDPWAQYYDGQTVLGLAYAYKATGDLNYLTGAERIAEYDLNQDYATKGDHWFVMAMNELTEILPEREEYYNAGLLAIARQEDIEILDQDATRLEKLMAGFALYQRAIANDIAIPDEFDINILVREIKTHANDLLNCYLFPEKAMYSPVLDSIIGTFYTEVPDGWKIRIDLIQHCLDAYYRLYLNLDELELQPAWDL